MKNATLLLLVACAFLQSACSTCPLARDAEPGCIQHVVLAWLRRPGNKEDQAKLIAASKTLKARIREVEHLSVGRALPSDRPVVDDSFDVALVMKFRDKAALDRYEKNPVHVQAVKEVLAPLTSKIVVHDIVSE